MCLRPLIYFSPYVWCSCSFLPTLKMVKLSFSLQRLQKSLEKVTVWDQDPTEQRVKCKCWRRTARNQTEGLRAVEQECKSPDKPGSFGPCWCSSSFNHQHHQRYPDISVTVCLSLQWHWVGSSQVSFALCFWLPQTILSTEPILQAHGLWRIILFRRIKGTPTESELDSHYTFIFVYLL